MDSPQKMVEMNQDKIANLVIWIHGVQDDGLDSKVISESIGKISRLLKNGVKWEHKIFNWDEEISPRENILWQAVQDEGENWLARQITHAICFIGCDMWGTLQTLKDGQPGYITYEIMQKLTALIDGERKPLEEEGYKVKIHLVCHSWGCFIGSRWIIGHPETDINFITMGCPLLYGSIAFKDWGSPDKIPNLKSWTNIKIKNDPIAKQMKFNPNPAWGKFVKDHSLSFWQPFPIKSHVKYWLEPKAHKLIADGLQNP